MGRQQIRNVAIIAHVDHGKTTLVNQLLRQSGQFRPAELQGDCILDSNPLERERGITIFAKNCAIRYTDPDGEHFHINIVDTPGHADFGGEVQRVLKMADGVLLLVDAIDGAMPQTRYVLGKALAEGLRPIVVINKMDRPEARPREVLNEVYDLLIDLGAEEDALEFPVIYASAREGWAVADLEQVPTVAARAGDGPAGNVHALFDAIIRHVPAPSLDGEGPLQVLITTLDYSDYVGRIGIGRVFAGTLRGGQEVARIDRFGARTTQRIGQLFRFDGLGRVPVDQINVGDICAVVGLEKVDIGDTLADPEHAVALPPVHVDEPTLRMTFRINDGPFAGREGKYVTSRHLRERLERELQSNVALAVDFSRGQDEFEVAGRGLMHLGILLENMRREGYELTVGKPMVIDHQKNGHRTEPIERLTVDAPAPSVGSVMQLIGERRGELIRMENRGGRSHMEFSIPARGLIGLASRMLTATAGEAILHHSFDRYDDYRGALPGRANGVMIATETGTVTGYALDQLTGRGDFFVAPTEPIYAGMIVGEHCKEGDIPVNAVKQKRLTNMRNANKEATVTLKTPRRMSLEAALEYIEADELVELTPTSIRLRKRMLNEIDRRRAGRKLV